MQKNLKMTESQAHWYSHVSTLQELSNEYQHRRGLDGFHKSLHPCALGENSLSIGKVDTYQNNFFPIYLNFDLWNC